jgi:hypothetical protein
VPDVNAKHSAGLHANSEIRGSVERLEERLAKSPGRQRRAPEKPSKELHECNT